MVSFVRPRAFSPSQPAHPAHCPVPRRPCAHRPCPSPHPFVSAIWRAVRPSRLASSTEWCSPSAAATRGASRPAIRASSGPLAGPTKLPSEAQAFRRTLPAMNCTPRAMPTMWRVTRHAGYKPGVSPRLVEAVEPAHAEPLQERIIPAGPPRAFVGGARKLACGG